MEKNEENMTFPEVLTIGTACLEKYDSRLKKQVKGKRPFSRSASVIKRKHDFPCCSFSFATKEEIEQVIDQVLEELIGLENGFVVSEPQPVRPGIQEDTVSHNDVSLSFTYGSNVMENLEVLWVSCWYYPAA